MIRISNRLRHFIMEHPFSHLISNLSNKIHVFTIAISAFEMFLTDFHNIQHTFSTHSPIDLV